LTEHNAGLNGRTIEAREADMFEGISGPFDVVIFNPPYLPTTEGDRVPGPVDAALSGGPGGDELMLRFIRGLPDILGHGGRAYLVVSSLTRLDGVQAELAGRFQHRPVGEADAGMERLEVWELAFEPAPGGG
jgi:release factor glutamine methyltransferase